MRLADLGRLRRKSQGLITEVTHCFGDYYTVKVEPEKGFTWIPGEYALFSLKDKGIKGRRWRVFSIASIPEEGYILLGFRAGERPSPYKRYIIEDGLHATIHIRGPLGGFTLRNDHRPVVLFGAGVGVTPVFSLLKAIGANREREVHVVYPSAQRHLFKDEIDGIAHMNPSIHLWYMHQPEEAQAKLSELARSFGNEAYYYAAGPGRVLKSVRRLLTGLGIEKRHLLNDPFHGYR